VLQALFGSGDSQTTWTVIILYVALVIYVLASFMERNPGFGAVYIWVLFAIKANPVVTAYSDIQTNAVIVVIILILALCGISGKIYQESS